MCWLICLFIHLAQAISVNFHFTLHYHHLWLINTALAQRCSSEPLSPSLANSRETFYSITEDVGHVKLLHHPPTLKALKLHFTTKNGKPLFELYSKYELVFMPLTLVF